VFVGFLFLGATFLTGCPGEDPTSPGSADHSPAVSPPTPSGVASMSHFIPVVSERMTEYPEIRFYPEDTITIGAGGCVDTGDAGEPMRRYVNPLGKDSERLYSGRVWIPGVTPGLPPVW
jgi:hypothetical protein